jgi:hypothetical protein
MFVNGNSEDGYFYVVVIMDQIKNTTNDEDPIEKEKYCKKMLMNVDGEDKRNNCNRMRCL